MKREYCIQGEAYKDPTWTDAGSKANHDLSLFPIIPTDNKGYKIDTFYAQRRAGHINPNPTTPEVWVLKLRKVRIE